MARIAVQKKTIPIFFLHEFFLYASQLLVFCIVGLFASDFLTDESRLVQYSQTRINENTTIQFVYIFFATFCVIGFLKVIDQASNSRLLKNLITDVVQGIPNLIYVFGSSVGGVMMSIAMFLAANPKDPNNALSFGVAGVIFSIIMFFYGAILSYWLKKDTHIQVSRSNLSHEDSN